MPPTPDSNNSTSTPVLRWSIVLVTVALGVALFHVRGRPPRADDIIRVSFTVLPKDRFVTQCAQPVDRAGHLCRFDMGDDGRIRPSRRQGAGKWLPLWTTDRMLYLVEGVFEDPDVQRVAAQREQLPERERRFLAQCRVRLVQWLADGKVRFNPRDRWDPHIANWQLEVVDCEAQ